MRSGLICAALAALLSSAPCEATVVTFDELVPGGLSYDYLSPEQIRFQTFNVLDGSLVAIGPDQGGADPNGIALGVQSSLFDLRGLNIYTNQAGPGTAFPWGSFDNPTFDIAALGSEGGAVTILYYLATSSQPISQSVALTGTFQTIASPYTNVLNVQVRPASGNVAFQVDNFSFQAYVPEPSTWALMILGFGAIGLALRSDRKRRLPSLLMR